VRLLFHACFDPSVNLARSRDDALRQSWDLSKTLTGPDPSPESTPKSGGGQRRGEATKRLSRYDRIAAVRVPSRTGHGIGVLGEPGRVVLARQVGRGCLVSLGTQLPFHQVLVPSHVSGAMDQRETRSYPYPLFSPSPARGYGRAAAPNSSR
jgi:hypothetical protein